MSKPSSHEAEQEGTQFPGKTYADVVLAPAYHQAKQELLEPMLAVNKAQLIMLTEQAWINQADASRIALALQTLNVAKIQNSDYTGEFEDLFFQVEQALLTLAGEAAGNLHLARSRNDMGIAIYRIVLRDKVLQTLTAALALHQTLQEFAVCHIETLMIAHTHAQQAQPTTLAHYVAAVNDSLERDIKRLEAAYANCNRSSLGAAALTTSGYAISRERLAELLAFEEIIENAYDAVSGADYVGEISSAIQLAAINLGRFVQDLLLWCTQEFAALRIADPYVQISSIMPQKRNPVSIEHTRALLSSAAGDAATALRLIHNTPFGDIVDTEDELQPYAWRSLGTLASVYRLLGKVIDTLEVNKELLRQRAYASFAVVTELADTLVRQEGLSFRTAHGIVSQIVNKLSTEGASIQGLTLAVLNEAVGHRLGRTLRLTETEFAQAVDPAHFITVRRLRGGPNKEELTRALQVQADNRASHRQWLDRKRQAIRGSQQTLEEQLEVLRSNASPP